MKKFTRRRWNHSSWQHKFGWVNLKKIFTALLSLGLVFSMNVTVMADTIQELEQQKQQIIQQQNEAKAQRDAFLSSYNSMKETVEDIEIELQMMDSKIETLINQINANEKDLEATNQEIEKTQKEITEREEDIKEKQEVLDQRMTALYKSGTNGYISIILKSEGLGDFISRIEAVNKIADYDKKIINEMNEQKKELEEQKATLDLQKIKIEKLRAENIAKKAELDKFKSEQQAILAENQAKMKEFDEKVNYYYDLISRLEAQKQEKDRQITILRNRAQSSSSTSRGTTSANYSSDALVQYALSFRGVPYKWGGTTPSGFDCSGFVQYVYAHFGIHLSRTTYTQIKEGVAVSRNNLQPGDLVFFGYGSPHHVGIYIGDNAYVHAPQTGDVVKISPLTRKDYMGARRVR